MQQSTKHHPKESKGSLGYTSKAEDRAMTTAPHTQTTLFHQRNSSRKILHKDLIVFWQCSDYLWCIIFLTPYIFSDKVPCSPKFSSPPSTCGSEVKKESWLLEIPGDEHQAYSETYLLLSMSAIEIFETPIKGYPKEGYLFPQYHQINWSLCPSVDFYMWISTPPNTCFS